jgi:hypothetical protein
LVLFFKKEPLALWAGTDVTPIPQESGSRPVGIREFFFEKKTKKLSQGCRGLVGDSRAKVFASFFKKKRFLSYVGGKLGNGG